MEMENLATICGVHLQEHKSQTVTSETARLGPKWKSIFDDLL